MATKKRAKNVTTSKSGNTAQYWDMVDEIIEVSKKYTQKIKLRANLLDPSTAFKVQHVLDNYYGGRMSNLVEAIGEDAECFYAKVVKINNFLLSEGLPTIKDSKKLLELLINTERRGYYRKKAEGGRKTDIIIPLDVIEMNYRGRK
jgi:hypothetical protein